MATVRASFNRIFWNEEAGCLYDVVNGEGATLRSDRIRSSPSVLQTQWSRTKSRGILRVVERELLTPRGFARFRQETRVTSGRTRAIRAVAMAPIIRAPFGRG